MRHWTTGPVANQAYGQLLGEKPEREMTKLRITLATPSMNCLHSNTQVAMYILSAQPSHLERTAPGWPQIRLRHGLSRTLRLPED